MVLDHITDLARMVSWGENVAVTVSSDSSLTKRRSDLCLLLSQVLSSLLAERASGLVEVCPFWNPLAWPHSLVTLRQTSRLLGKA